MGIQVYWWAKQQPEGKSNDTNNVKIQACKMLKEKFFPPRVVNYLRREEGKAKSE